MTQPMRAAIVGTGFAGSQHADAVRRLPGAKIALVVGSSETRGQEAAAQLGVERGTGDWRTAVEDPTVDVVHVCVPSDLHVPVALAALAAGKHVICEKPLALDVAGARSLADAARTSDGRVVLGHNYRFYPQIAELRFRAMSGDLGQLHAVRGAYLQDWLLDASDTNWRVDAARGGASRAIADIGSHWVDLAEVVIGRRLVAVHAVLQVVHPQRPLQPPGTFMAGTRTAGDHQGVIDVVNEDQAMLLLRFEGGLLGTLTVSQVAAGHKNDLAISIDGSRGSATWEQERPDDLWIGRRDRSTEQVARRTVSAGGWSLSRLPPGHTEGWADGLRNMVAAAYGLFRGEEAPEGCVPLATFEDGLRHLCFIEAAMRSAREGRWVAVDDLVPRDSRLSGAASDQ